MDLSGAHVLDDTGHFVSEEHRHVAEIISEYEPTLSVVWIPPDKRSGNEEFPFAILHTPDDGRQPYIVRKVRHAEMNANLIAWLWMNDQAREGKDAYNRLKAIDDALEALKLKKQTDAREEANEIAKTIIASPLNTYKHDGKVYR